MEIALIGNLLHETKYNTSIFENIYKYLYYDKELECCDKIYNIFNLILRGSIYIYIAQNPHIKIIFYHLNCDEKLNITPDKIIGNKMHLTHLLSISDDDNIDILIKFGYGGEYMKLIKYKQEIYDILHEYCGLIKK
jgi:hypothetical protein